MMSDRERFIELMESFGLHTTVVSREDDTWVEINPVYGACVFFFDKAGRFSEFLVNHHE